MGKLKCVDCEKIIEDEAFPEDGEYVCVECLEIRSLEDGWLAKYENFHAKDK